MKVLLNALVVWSLISQAAIAAPRAEEEKPPWNSDYPFRVDGPHLGKRLGQTFDEWRDADYAPEVKVSKVEPK